MLRRISMVLVLLSLLSIIACKKKVPVSALKGYWYKRYTGTIAGQPVVVSLFCTGDNTARGTYYYVNKSEILYLSLNTDSANAGHVIIEESLITDRETDEETADEDSEMTNFWDVVFDADSVSGKFHKDKGAPVYTISLHEDYAGSYPFAYARFDDSVIVKGKTWNGDAIASCIGIMPASSVSNNDADFIAAGIHSVLSIADATKPPTAKTTQQNYQKAFVQDYLDGYKKDAQEWVKDTIPPNPLGRYERYADIIPLYTSNGFLVIGNQWYDYSGGAHGNHGSSYVNMDVQRKKVWQLADVMQVDSAAISWLLDAEARIKFKVTTGTAIENILLVSTVPATGNFIIADRGITFCYDPYEIASYADGEIKLFIPYNKLKSLLKPEFVARMGLKL